MYDLRFMDMKLTAAVLGLNDSGQRLLCGGDRRLQISQPI
jgi:hypothetical protein